ncbi:MAG: hypothetical protein IPO21_14815 [Bacteroidales bacterium]|nr:hypothetical protein [Bacteroidales bacterium]
MNRLQLKHLAVIANATILLIL